MHNVHVVVTLSQLYCHTLMRRYIANNSKACCAAANVLLKAHVLHHSDREQELGCLRRMEKLQ